MTQETKNWRAGELKRPIEVDTKNSGIPSRKLKLPAISLFSGVGGLDLGLETAGFDVRLCIEIDPLCRESLLKQGRTVSSVGDVCNLSPKQAMREAGLRQGELALLFGGPPCQPFSKARQWSGQSPLMNDQMAKDTIGVFIDYIEHTLPEVVLLENVSGFGRQNSGLGVVETSLAEINRRHKTNYRLSVWKLNAANYGLPQARHRVIAVASRAGLNLQSPSETHGPGLLPFATAWDAIGHLNDSYDLDPQLKVSGRWAELLPSIPEGMNYLYHTPKGLGRPLFGFRTRFWSFLLKLSKRLPSWTIMATPGSATGPFHWKSRRLAIREMLCLQTFPEDHPVALSYSDARRQIGNAVPPALGELLGREIVFQAFQGSQRIDSLVHMPPPRLPIAPAEDPKPVAARYHALEGQHAAHPGAGLGPRAHSLVIEHVGEVERAPEEDMGESDPILQLVGSRA
jgi:DNA (cytosine-5)-methyltransferase 1